MLVSLLTGALSGCGVIIINPQGAETTEGATTVAPETAIPAETSGEDTGAETEPPAQTDPSVTTQKGEPVEFPSTRKEEAQARLDALSADIDISGFDIVIANALDTAEVFFASEDAPLYAVLSTRNTMLYDKYGVDVLTLSTYQNGADSETIYKDLSAAIKTGSGSSYYLDLLFLPASSAGRFLAGGLLKDMRLLPFYNAGEGVMSGNVGNSRYFDLGAGSDSPEHIYAVYFNRSLFGAAEEKALFSAALDGSLSWEDLITASKTVEGCVADIAAAQGKGLLGELASPLLGIDYVTKDSKGVPKLAMSEQERASIDSFIDTVMELSFYAPAEGEVSGADRFTSASLPFYLGTLADMTLFYDEPTEWGLLPLPSERDLNAVSHSHPVVCIPATNVRLEQTSIWLTGFNAASGDWIRDQYLAVSIEKYLRDNNSCLTMYEILSRKSVLGFERLFDGYYSELADATYSAAASAMSGENKFSEIYLKKLSAVNKKLAKLPS